MLHTLPPGGVVIFTAVAFVAWTVIVYWWAFGAGKACGLAEVRRMGRVGQGEDLRDGRDE